MKRIGSWFERLALFAVFMLCVCLATFYTLAAIGVTP